MQKGFLLNIDFQCLYICLGIIVLENFSVEIEKDGLSGSNLFFYYVTIILISNIAIAILMVAIQFSPTV